jgi:hypothetical protein
MPSSNVTNEFRHQWLPYVTDAGLNRLVGLLESGNPLLIHGAFAKNCAMGCLATHIAWNHPQTEQYREEAGVRWLTHIAKLNPATSYVVLAWDRSGMADWDLRNTLLEECRNELLLRETEDEQELELGELCWS